VLISKQYPFFSLAQQPQETVASSSTQLQYQVSVISGDERKSYGDKNLEED